MRSATHTIVVSLQEQRRLDGAPRPGVAAPFARGCLLDVGADVAVWWRQPPHALRSAARSFRHAGWASRGIKRRTQE